MAKTAAATFDDTDLTLRLAAHAMEMRFEALPADTIEIARHCLLDWLGVTLAGSREPLAEIMKAVRRKPRFWAAVP